MVFNNEEELVEYAKRLENKSIAEAISKLPSFEFFTVSDVSTSYGGKGSFGEYIEEAYFGKKNDTKSKADFDEVGVELKTVPLKVLGNGKVRVKERIVLNKFKYFDIANETFETSHFLEKDSKLLLVFYHYDNSVALEDKRIDIVELWDVLSHDIDQIREDWETIVNKIKAGKAHELSEGDTLYLGACTKGSTRALSMQKQPFSDILAPGRALCFKVSYANMIYNLLKEKRALKEAQETSIYGREKWKPLSERIHDLVDKYIGKSGKELCAIFKRPYNPKDKSLYAHLSRIMLEYSRNKEFYEFKAANIQVKAIRIEKDGRIVQAMSFKNIPYKDIIYQKWEDSDFYNELTSKFIFMIFRECQDVKDYFFDGFYMWNMPAEDLAKTQEVWEMAKQLVLVEDFDDMPDSRFNGVAHVRPKATDSHDLMETVTGTMQKKKCFWLNNSYVRGVIRQLQSEDKDKE